MTGMKPHVMTTVDVPRWLARNDRRGRIMALVQLAKDWACLPDRRAEIVTVPPARHRWYHRWTPRKHDLARIAAVVHALCDRDGHPIPDWVWDYRANVDLDFMGRPESDSGYARYIRSVAPSACAYHRVWFDPESIQDIRVHGPTPVLTPDGKEIRR